MMDRTLLVDGIQVPQFLYGTAWKEDATERLTSLALQQGFRGIDTANQRKHYHEAGVGKAVAAAIENGLVRREDLFLQTKFTFQRGQDHRERSAPDQQQSNPGPIDGGQHFAAQQHLFGGPVPSTQN